MDLHLLRLEMVIGHGSYILTLVASGMDILLPILVIAVVFGAG